MSNMLSSKDFGLKLYSRFPPKYREDDENNNLALKRYLMSLSDGGFGLCIDDINGLTNIIDPYNVKAGLLPTLFQQYGLEIFNGIPEEYLRFLLPKLGELWSRKGSISVVDFVTSSLTGIKTTTVVKYADTDNPIIDIKLEMDYNKSSYYPESGQLKRVLSNFVPFFCDLEITYISTINDESRITLFEKSSSIITSNIEEVGVINIQNKNNNSTFDQAVLGEFVLGEAFYDTFEDHIKTTQTESIGIVTNLDFNSTTNSVRCPLNTGFYTNTVFSFDKVTFKGQTDIRF